MVSRRRRTGSSPLATRSSSNPTRMATPAGSSPVSVSRRLAVHRWCRVDANRTGSDDPAELATANDVAHGGDGLAAVGAGNGFEPEVWVSATGEKWDLIPTDLFGEEGGEMQAVEPFDHGWLATGDNVGETAVRVGMWGSLDGRTWQIVESPGEGFGTDLPLTATPHRRWRPRRNGRWQSRSLARPDPDDRGIRANGSTVGTAHGAPHDVAGSLADSLADPDDHSSADVDGHHQYASRRAASRVPCPRRRGRCFLGRPRVVRRRRLRQPTVRASADDV